MFWLLNISYNNLHFYLQYGDTPIHTAARYGHAGVARILMSAKCNTNLQNKVRRLKFVTSYKHDFMIIPTLYVHSIYLFVKLQISSTLLDSIVVSK